jgi:hypothetical protein
MNPSIHPYPHPPRRTLHFSRNYAIGDPPPPLSGQKNTMSKTSRYSTFFIPFGNNPRRTMLIQSTEPTRRKMTLTIGGLLPLETPCAPGSVGSLLTVPYQVIGSNYVVDLDHLLTLCLDGTLPWSTEYGGSHPGGGVQSVGCTAVTIGCFAGVPMAAWPSATLAFLAGGASYRASQENPINGFNPNDNFLAKIVPGGLHQPTPAWQPPAAKGFAHKRMNPAHTPAECKRRCLDPVPMNTCEDPNHPATARATPPLSELIRAAAAGKQPAAATKKRPGPYIVRCNKCARSAMRPTSNPKATSLATPRGTCAGHQTRRLLAHLPAADPRYAAFKEYIQRPHTALMLSAFAAVKMAKGTVTACTPVAGLVAFAKHVASPVTYSAAIGGASSTCLIALAAPDVAFATLTTALSRSTKCGLPPRVAAALLLGPESGEVNQAPDRISSSQYAWCIQHPSHAAADQNADMGDIDPFAFATAIMFTRDGPARSSHGQRWWSQPYFRLVAMLHTKRLTIRCTLETAATTPANEYAVGTRTGSTLTLVVPDGEFQTFCSIDRAFLRASLRLFDPTSPPTAFVLEVKGCVRDAYNGVDSNIPVALVESLRQNIGGSALTLPTPRTGACLLTLMGLAGWYPTQFSFDCTHFHPDDEPAECDDSGRWTSEKCMQAHQILSGRVDGSIWALLRGAPVFAGHAIADLDHLHSAVGHFVSHKLATSAFYNCHSMVTVIAKSTQVSGPLVTRPSIRRGGTSNRRTSTSTSTSIVRSSDSCSSVDFQTSLSSPLPARPVAHAVSLGIMGVSGAGTPILSE